MGYLIIMMIFTVTAVKKQQQTFATIIMIYYYDTRIISFIKHLTLAILTLTKLGNSTSSQVQTIRNNPDCQASLPPSCAKSCFHGQPLCNFEPVNEDLVKRTILNSTAKTCDVDAFPTHLLLDSVFNDSLASGIFPSSFKTALVKPLLEKPSLNPNDLKNYRPVSNLPFLSKIPERIVLSQLNDHLTSNCSAPSNQHIDLTNAQKLNF